MVKHGQPLERRSFFGFFPGVGKLAVYFGSAVGSYHWAESG